MSEEALHARGILDTSTVIVLEKLPDAHALPAEPLITAITLAELSVGPLVAKDERERVARAFSESFIFGPFLPRRRPGRSVGRVAPTYAAEDGPIADLINEVPQGATQAPSI